MPAMWRSDSTHLMLCCLLSVQELSVSRVLQYAGVYLVGLTPYIYMPVIDTVALKPGSWGDTSTVSGFLRHFLRKGAAIPRACPHCSGSHALCGALDSRLWHAALVRPGCACRR